MNALALRCFVATAFLLVSTLCCAQAQRVRVGVVLDGPTDRQTFTPELVAREVPNVTGGELDIVLPADKRFVGDWSLNGIDAALTSALEDDEVDVVLTLGILASHQAAHRESLRKPVLAPLVIDPTLQSYPLKDGTSGRKNFAYAADFQSVGNEVREFHRIVGFKHLVALVEEAFLESLPELTRRADLLAAELNVRISIVRIGPSVDAALAALPPDADAVYVTGLLRFGEEDMRKLAQGLIARRLPSFSVIGKRELESGLLMTTGGAQRDVERLARRVVLMIQRIAQGQDPATFEVSFPSEQRLILNMRTAREIGFSPRWQFLADAEQMYAADMEPEPALTLLDAMNAALDANPALAASRARLAADADDIRIARSELLPSLDASASRTKIDSDRASPLVQAEDTTLAGLSLEQVIYSERAWAGHAISRMLYEASEQGQRRDVLDTLERTADAYLDLLRAKSVETVRRGNVDNTRRNLETSRVREAVGLAGRSDYLRWVAQLAGDKQNLLAAESARRQAETELMRIIHHPGNQPFTTAESGIDDSLAFIASPRAQAYLDTPAKWAVFMEYVVHTALGNAPEIAQTDALVESRQRSVTAAQRAFYLPDLALVSNGSRILDDRGAGSGATGPGVPDDEAWSVSLQARFPLFTSGRRSAELSQARNELRAFEADRAVVTDAVEARARTVLHRTASSFPAIELSREAAAAANENLDMVSDAYARGAVSVTDLIDAQDAALEAGLSAADAKYTFLIDFVAVMRAMNEFDVLLDPTSREAWFQRVDDWFKQHGDTPRPVR